MTYFLLKLMLVGLAASSIVSLVLSIYAFSNNSKMGTAFKSYVAVLIFGLLFLLLL